MRENSRLHEDSYDDPQINVGNSENEEVNSVNDDVVVEYIFRLLKNKNYSRLKAILLKVLNLSSGTD